MANTYKNIVITPNKGSSTDDPKIVFSGANTTVNTDITLRVYPTTNGTLSFEGSAGQLFSITNDLTGSIFSVNDVSGIPSIDVNASGNIQLAPFTGNVSVGKTTATYELDVQGTINASAVLVNGAPISGGLKYTANLGNGTANTFNIAHNLNTTAVIPAVRENATGFYVYPDMMYTSPNNIELDFVSAPTTNQYFIIVLGA